MFWSQNNNRMEETTMELESVNSSDDLVTHAALASDKSRVISATRSMKDTNSTNNILEFLIVAVATASKQLRLVKIEIQWSGPGSQPDKNPLPQNARLSPSLVEKHLAATNWLHNGPDDVNNDLSMAQLSHLHVLPSLMDNTGKNTVPPMIVAVRLRAPNTRSYQMAQTVLDRWEAIDQRQTLHPAFEQLGNRRNSISTELPSSMRLQKLEPIIINKVLIGIQPIQFGKVLVLTMSDGTVEYRDRFTFEELYVAEDTNKVMSLRQVGWTFNEEGPCECLKTAKELRDETLLTFYSRLTGCVLSYSLLNDSDGR